MVDEVLSLESIMKLACGEILNERGAVFGALDVSDVEISPKTANNFKKSLRAALIKSKTWYITFKKTAIACVIAIAVLLGGVVTIEPLRDRVFNVIVKKYSQCVELIFEADREGENYQTVSEKKIPIVPEGWIIKKLDETDESVYRIYAPNGDKILYIQSPFNTHTWLDNSNHAITEIILDNGSIAYLFEYEDGYIALIWQADYRYQLSGHHISGDVLIELANTIN